MPSACRREESSAISQHCLKLIRTTVEAVVAAGGSIDKDIGQVLDRLHSIPLVDTAVTKRLDVRVIPFENCLLWMPLCSKGKVF